MPLARLTAASPSNSFPWAGRLRLAGGGEAGQIFLLGPLSVQFQEAGEDFVADKVGPAKAPGFLAAAAGFLGAVVFVFVIEQEFALALGNEVGPTVGFEDGAVHGGVEFAQTRMSGEASSGLWKRL